MSTVFDSTGEWDEARRTIVSILTEVTVDNFELQLRRVSVLTRGDPELKQVAQARGAMQLKALEVPDPSRTVKAFLQGAEPVGEDPASILFYPHVEPWDEPVSGVELLDELVRYYSGPVIHPPGGAEACALYAVMTYTVEHLRTCPYLAHTSPTMRAGKTRQMTLHENVVRRPLLTPNCSPSAVFRECDAHQPTLLIDEAETFIDNEELRGVLNAGYKSGAYVVRVERDGNGTFVPMRYNTFGPKIFGLIGKLPPTLMDRSIVVQLKRKRADEVVDSFDELDQERYESWGGDLARKIVRWVGENEDALRKCRPELPESLDDRARDNWRPLLRIADVAGGEWPIRAREVAELLSVERDERRDDAKVQLLWDCFELFPRDAQGRMQPFPVSTLQAQLAAMEERPWAEWHETRKPVTSDRVGKLLGEFGIKSKVVRQGEKTSRCYRPEDFTDPWLRHGVLTGEDE